MEGAINFFGGLVCNYMKTEVREGFESLEKHYQDVLKSVHMRELFDNDPDRFNKFHLELQEASLLFDYSKNIITEETMNLLLDICKRANLPASIESMFNGDKINTTEDRAVLHVALRDPTGLDFIYLHYFMTLCS